MNKLSLLFESPPWLIGVGILLGVAYAAILYFKSKVPWGNNTNYVLAILRFMLVVQLTLLLFGPLIRQINNTVEPPSVVLAIDNSQSIAEVEDSADIAGFNQQISDLSQAINDEGYLTEIRTLNDRQYVQRIEFDERSSNINALLQGIQNDYESRNLSNVILFSDGLYNLGNNPAFHPFTFPISTVGLGDTSQRPDLNLNALLYNKIAYQGNTFPVVAELFSYHLANQTINVVIEKNREVLAQKQVKVGSQNQFDQVKFLIEARQSGMQRFTVRAETVAGEAITSNNSKDAYIDIIDGKQKILIAAPAPHPDLKAIKSALESNENYEIELYIQGISDFTDQKYDAVVLHQIPHKKGQYSTLLDKIRKDKTPSLFVFGNETDINRFNALNGTVEVLPISYQRDNVTPSFNQSFTSFIYESERKEVLHSYPPVSVPFANFNVLPQAEVLLFQKVGKVMTQKPLLLIRKNDEWNTAALLGEGVWTWRLQEYATTQTHKSFDELISKVIQYLSTKEDKRRFKVYPIKNEFLNSEAVVFETEVYNDIYEQTFGHKIELKVTDEQNNTRGYSYVTSEKTRDTGSATWKMAYIAIGLLPTSTASKSR
ncbi:MAG: VWA domain-containing protein, partial [Cyclobacteriaceae bacterium]|nr:VWA domain-containing protein [Cyclobacteriaceae bacterium]